MGYPFSFVEAGKSNWVAEIIKVMILNIERGF